jgi:hypothetical protein
MSIESDVSVKAVSVTRLSTNPARVAGTFSRNPACAGDAVASSEPWR